MTTLRRLSCALALILCTALAYGKPVVATTFTLIADMAREVAGEHADIVSITKPGAEIHHYEPTPRDILNAQKADLILWNGLNLELWFTRFFSQLQNVPSVVVSDGITPIAIHGGEYDGKPNPHAWMSFANAAIYIDNIATALADIDPEHADAYRQNADAYKARLAALREDIAARVAAIPAEQRWLVSSEGAFSYLAADLGLREAFVWPTNADQQGTPQQIRAVIETMRTHQIPVIFSESTVSDKTARQIAAESGARYGGVLYVDSLSAPDGPVPTFLDLLQVTTDTILSGFAPHE